MIKAEEHVGLVHMIAKKYKNISFMEYEDIIGYGMIGLVKAANKFDETRGIKFSSFACNVINNNILIAFRDDKSRLGTCEMKINGTAQSAIPMSYLTIRNNDGDESELEVAIEEDFTDCIIEKICLKDSLDRLDDKLKNIVDLYYIKEKTQVELSKELKTSQAQISRLIKRCNQKLRINMIGGVRNEQINSLRI